VLSILGNVGKRYTQFTAKALSIIITESMKTGLPHHLRGGQDEKPQFNAYQRSVLNSLPTTLDGALSCLDIKGKYTMYAACPKCNFTNRELSTGGPDPLFPSTCGNMIVGDNGHHVCGAQLLKPTKPGAIQQPLKPYAVASLKDYLARTMADPKFVSYSNEAMDRASKQKLEQEWTMGDAFDGDFLVNKLKAADGGRFVDRGEKTRLSFVLHTDFFNPNGSTNRGPHHSIGIISAANLALPASIRYLPEYMFVAAIIPGPSEPPREESDHYLRPVIEQFVEAWKPGFFIAPTAKDSSQGLPRGGTVVECALTISLNDLPAARKFCGFAGSNSKFLCTLCKLYGRDKVWNTNFDSWKRRDPKVLRKLAEEWRDAENVKKRKQLFTKNGVRWSSFWLLPYWDPTHMLVVDGMHAILEGLVQYECRDVLRLDVSTLKEKKSNEGTAYAFRHTWDPPDYYSATLQDTHAAEIPKVQTILELALRGDNSITLCEMWKKLENKPYGALKAVALSLQLGRRRVDDDESENEQGTGSESDEGESYESAQEVGETQHLKIVLETAVEQAYLDQLFEKYKKGKMKTLPTACKALTIGARKEKAPLIAFLLNWVSIGLLL
jgi:hypothetical protein